MPEEKTHADDEDDNIEGLTDAEIRKYIERCWKKEFRPFYNPQDFDRPISDAEAKRGEEDLQKELRNGIANVRTSKNLLVKWKPLVRDLQVLP